MKNIELVNGISWHLECMALSMAAINNFRPPADLFQMQMYYSLYATNLMSAIDMMNENRSSPFLADLEDNLKTSKFSGAHVLSYIRELRNGIIHRGVDPASGGEVVDGLVCAIATSVQDRKGVRSYDAPAHLLRDIFIHCEISAKPLLERYLEPDLEELASMKPDDVLDDTHKAIDACSHIPDWVKKMARKHIEAGMPAKAQAHKVEKLQRLLTLPAGQPIV